jgi:hypothetical protein
VALDKLLGCLSDNPPTDSEQEKTIKAAIQFLLEALLYLFTGE